MADIAVTAASVRPLKGAITRRGVAGGALVPGEAVYLDGANGWKKADADDVAQAQARGVVISDGVGSVAFVTGQTVDIVVYGPVTGYAAMTPGAVEHVSTTAGAIVEAKPATAGDFPFVIGWAESATTLFVAPQIIVPTVNAG